MATIDDLPISEFSKMSDEELLELVKGVRQRRRSPDPVVREECKKKAVAKRKRGKAIALQDVTPMLDGISKEGAAALLKQLRGES